MITCSIIQGGRTPVDIKLPVVPREGELLSYDAFNGDRILSKVKKIRWVLYKDVEPYVEVMLMREDEFEAAHQQYRAPSLLP